MLSKVVGDLAQFMVAKKLTPQMVIDKAAELDLPSSVIEFLQGQLGIPLGGFPEPLRSRVLKKAGLKAIEGRPGSVLAPLDFQAVQKKLLEKHGPQFARWQDVNSYVMYPSVFDEYAEVVKRFGQVTNLPTPYFLEPLSVGGSACTFQLQGATAPTSVKLLAVDKVGAEDSWNVTLKVNDDKEVITIKSKKKGTVPYVLKNASGAKDAVETVVKADPSKPGQLGSPLPGVVLRFAVKDGAQVSKGQPVVVLNSMKMETVISATISGKVALKSQVGAEVISGQLLFEVTP